ncbi:rCG37297, isoform CRA_a [Rattus norvegicus]|uniref:RCG37297, isoform CRA_a n=1 Tax=Rattus norvegicus TaxID=10116 RepID=A6KHK8_RAT|nr:rCG37297, isoform CRA_a [Rattus norvegicus]
MPGNQTKNDKGLGHGTN